MNQEQRARALRMAGALDELDNAFSAPGLCGEAADLLRELAAEPERVPLTDEQIIDIREDCTETPLELRDKPYGWAINFARRLERAHGIV